MKLNLPRLSRVQVRLLAAGTAVVALLLLSVGMATAQESTNFRLDRNSLVGGNYGGTTMSSASFRLHTSTGSLQEVSVTGTGFQLCSGYLCQTRLPFFRDLYLPELLNQSE